MENKYEIEKALDFFKKGKYEDAISEFEVALEDSPDDNGILNNLGLCYSKLANDSKAEEYYLQALSKNKTAVETYINLADLYYKNKNIENAIWLLETANTLIPDNIVLMHYLARLYIDDVKYDIAFDMINRILEISPENVDAYWDLGNLSLETGDYQSSVAAFEHVLEKVDNNPIIYYQTGLAYEACDNINKALSNFLKAIALNPDMPHSYKKAAVMFLAQGDKTSAKEYLDDYLKFDLPIEEKDNINAIIANISM